MSSHHRPRAARGPEAGDRLVCPWSVDACIFTEPQQGATYDQLLEVAQCAETSGFDGFFRSDHYLHMAGDGRPGPTDAWTTLAGLARETDRIRLGTLVTSATFRHPGSLAVIVAQVDQMSRGRVTLGLGAGWYEAEHAAFGIPFPPPSERFDRLGEQLAILTGLWSAPEGETFDFEGRYYHLRATPALVRPYQTPRPPIVVGGTGRRRTPELAARYADEYNVPFVSVAAGAAAFGRARAACEAIGRDPATLALSAATVICCGATPAEFAERAAAIGRDPAELRTTGAAGTPDEVREVVARWQEAGAERIYLQLLDLADLDHVRLVASEVFGLVA